jgi:hypothetical protein
MRNNTMQQQQKLHTQLVPVMCVLHEQLKQPLMRALPNDPALLARCHQVEHLARVHHLPVRYFFAMETFAHHRVYPGPGRDLVLMRFEDYPLAQQLDKFPIPERNLSDLYRIEQVIEFDDIYILDEVEPGSVNPTGPLPLEPFLPPPSRRLVEESTRFGSWTEQLGRLMSSPWIWGASAAFATMTLPLVLTGLDPILFGLKTATGEVSPGNVAAFHYLTHWAWNEEAGG